MLHACCDDVFPSPASGRSLAHYMFAGGLHACCDDVFPDEWAQLGSSCHGVSPLTHGKVNLAMVLSCPARFICPCTYLPAHPATYLSPCCLTCSAPPCPAPPALPHHPAAPHLPRLTPLPCPAAAPCAQVALQSLAQSNAVGVYPWAPQTLDPRPQTPDPPVYPWAPQTPPGAGAGAGAGAGSSLQPSSLSPCFAAASYSGAGQPGAGGGGPSEPSLEEAAPSLEQLLGQLRCALLGQCGACPLGGWLLALCVVADCWLPAVARSGAWSVPPLCLPGCLVGGWVGGWHFERACILAPPRQAHVIGCLLA